MVIFYRIGLGYWIPAGKGAVARVLSLWGVAVLNILLYRYREISLVSYGYCTRACGTRANTLELTRDISRYQCNKIYIVYVYTAPARIYTPLIVSGSLRSLANNAAVRPQPLFVLASSFKGSNQWKRHGH